MTKKNALEIAISALTTDSYLNPNWTEDSPSTIRKEIPAEEVRDILSKMIAQLDKPHTSISDEKKAELNAKRKEATTTARKELVEKVAPVLRKYLTTPMTAKELYEAAKAELPADFSWQKVQNVLIRELAPELNKTKANGKANIYVLKG